MDTGSHGLSEQKLRVENAAWTVLGQEDLNYLLWNAGGSIVDKSYANKFDNLDGSYLQTQQNTYKISAETEKLIVKFIWDCKGGPNSQNNFKKEKLKGLTHIPISKLTTEL